MEEIEGLTEQTQEHIHHHAQHGGGPGWVSWVALMTAILSACAAVAALLSGGSANEAMLEQLHASDQWGYYQAKGIKSAIAQTRSDLLVAAGKQPDEALEKKIEQYKEEQAEIKKEGEEHEKESRASFARHETYAKAVTFLQVAISIAAISVLTKRRRYLIVALVFGAGGAAFLLYGFLHAF
ncbi:MAG: DUF4337 domain-containing protein [Verrucomicrobium sp.]|nr:DUF4337 domain-containing protein [Verrucomicrobium sp.]